jgi:hypothetical protein
VARFKEERERFEDWVDESSLLGEVAGMGATGDVWGSDVTGDDWGLYGLGRKRG